MGHGAVAGAAQVGPSELFARLATAAAVLTATDTLNVAPAWVLPVGSGRRPRRAAGEGNHR